MEPSEVNFESSQAQITRKFWNQLACFFSLNDSKVDDEKVEILKRMPQWVELSVDLDGFGEGRWTKNFGWTSNSVFFL